VSDPVIRSKALPTAVLVACEALEKHGDRIKSELPFVGALIVELHSDDVSELANRPWIDALPRRRLL